MGEVLWLLSGLAGAMLIWREIKMINRNDRDFTWCPSPLAIILMVAASLGGPLTLVVSVATTAIIAIIEIDPKTHWLTRPICRKRSSILSQESDRP